MGLKKLGHLVLRQPEICMAAMGMLVAVVVTIAQMDFGETNNFILKSQDLLSEDLLDI